jgi:hypothetical protein
MPALTNWELEHAPSDFGELASGGTPAGEQQPKMEIPEQLPPVGALEDVLPGEQAAGLRHLIVRGHKPDKHYKSRSEAVFAVVREMMNAGCAPGIIIAILLEPRFEISSSVLEKGRKARAYAERQVSQAIAKSGQGRPTGDQQQPDADAAGKVLVAINEKHFLSQESGQWRVYTEHIDRKVGRTFLLRSSQQDFRLKFADRFIVVDSPDGKAEVQTWANWWIANPRKRRYEHIDFLPGEQEVPGDTYNLWRGWAVEPRAGDWSRLKRHMLEIVCGGNPQYYDYLLKWMARKVQKPGEHGWSAIVYKGDEGVGKGLVASTFGSLFGQHFLHVSQSRHLVGNFNLHLRDCCLLFADEAFWAGDKQGEGTLKALISERDLPIEGKGRDLIMGQNRLGIMMASNHEWTIPAGPTARRYFALKVVNPQRNSAEYFDPIFEQIDNGGRAAMLHELLNTDLAVFDVRRVPKTPELIQQKTHSFDHITKWWFGALDRGTLADFHEEWMESGVRRSVLMADYNKTADQLGIRRERALPADLGRYLRAELKSLGGDWPRRKQITVYEDDGEGGDKRVQKEGYQFPPLTDCREAFAKKRDATLEDFGWDDDQ